MRAMRGSRSTAMATILACHLLQTPQGLAEGDAPGGEARDRSIDLQLHPVLSFPNLLGLCVEAYPGSGDRWSSTTCASIGVLGIGPNTNVQYRWTLYEGKTLTLSAGPGGGPRLFMSYRQGGTSRPGPGEEPVDEPAELGLVALWADAFASLEATWWGTTLGFSAQLDLGATTRLVEYEDSEAGPFYVLANFTIGVAIR